jgi:tRNA threonylcarbamoyladenosine biosynthesis protein TsaE
LTIQILCNRRELRKFAQSLAAVTRPPFLIGLSGDLGSGKTFFATSFIQFWNVEESVVSPTFTLMNRYETPVGPIWHGDFYRIRNPEECQELGLEAVFSSAIGLFEWPEQLGKFWPTGQSLRIQFEPTSPQSRKITISGSLPPQTLIRNKLVQF